MSIYKFMGGLVTDTIGLAPSQEEGEFDPHQHRVIAHPTTYTETMIHMLKGSIGAGILAMPYAMLGIGIIYSSVLLIVIGIFATYCFHLLIHVQYKLCRRYKRGYMSYQKSIHFSVRDGPPCMRWSSRLLYWFVEATLIIWQLGICTIYFLFVAENVKQVAAVYGQEFSLRVIVCIELGPMILLNMIKNLKMLAPCSAVSNVCITLGLLLVCYYMIEDDLEVGAEKLKAKDLLHFPLFIGTALFALEAVGVVLALEYNMANPKEFLGICGLFNIGMALIIFLYLAVGILGLLKYGDAIQASITLNLRTTDKKAQAAKLLFAIAIFLSFPLQNFVAYSILWRRISQRGKKKTAVAQSGGAPPPQSGGAPPPPQDPAIGTTKGVNDPPPTLPHSTSGGQIICDYFMRVFLVVVPFCLAVAVPSLGPFISLFGAFCLSLLAFIFPAIMSIAYGYPDDYGKLKGRLVRDITILIIGILIMVSGVFASIKEIIDAFE